MPDFAVVAAKGAFCGVVRWLLSSCTFFFFVIPSFVSLQIYFHILSIIIVAIFGPTQKRSRFLRRSSLTT